MGKLYDVSKYGLKMKASQSVSYLNRYLWGGEMPLC